MATEADIAYAAPRISEALEALCATSPIVDATAVRSAVEMDESVEIFDAAVDYLIARGVVQHVGNAPTGEPRLRHTGFTMEQVDAAIEAERREAAAEAARVAAQEAADEDAEDELAEMAVIATREARAAAAIAAGVDEDEEPAHRPASVAANDAGELTASIEAGTVRMSQAIAKVLGPDGMGKLVMAGMTEAETLQRPFRLVVTL